MELESLRIIPQYKELCSHVFGLDRRRTHRVGHLLQKTLAQRSRVHAAPRATIPLDRRLELRALRSAREQQHQRRHDRRRLTLCSSVRAGAQFRGPLCAPGVEPDGGGGRGEPPGGSTGPDRAGEEGPAAAADAGLLHRAETHRVGSRVRDLPVGVRGGRGDTRPPQVQSWVSPQVHRQMADGSVLLPDLPPVLVRGVPEDLGPCRREPAGPRGHSGLGTGRFSHWLPLLSSAISHLVAVCTEFIEAELVHLL